MSPPSLQTDDLLAGFVEESLHVLETLPQQLQRAAADPQDVEALNAVFRGVHTIKGNAAFFGFARLERFAHALESALDRLRSSEIRLTPRRQRHLTLGIDLLAQMLQRPAEDKIDAEYESDLLAKINSSHSAESQLEDSVSSCLGQLDQVFAEMQASSLAKARTAAGQPAEASTQRLLRVREEAVDQLVDAAEQLCRLSGQLGTRCDQLTLTMHARELEDLKGLASSINQQADGLHQSARLLRRVPASTLLCKLPGMARLVADALGKQVNLHIEGGDIEVDKSLLDELDAPLTHMIRNACDHAIELPEERILSGKPPVGNIWIACRTTATMLIVRMRDDGRGIDPRRIRRKAVAQGLISECQESGLSDIEVLELIFHPGFSTADQITEFSGRGVGMDVVRTTLRQFGGDIYTESRPGVGTTFELQVPLR